MGSDGTTLRPGKTQKRGGSGRGRKGTHPKVTNQVGSLSPAPGSVGLVFVSPLQQLSKPLKPLLFRVDQMSGVTLGVAPVR